MRLTPILALALLPCFALAETTTQVDVAKQLEVITTNLKLSPSQQGKVQAILVEEVTKRKAIEANTKLSEKQRHDQVGAIHRASCQQMKAVFTSEQQKLIEVDMNHTAKSPTSPKTGA